MIAETLLAFQIPLLPETMRGSYLTACQNLTYKEKFKSKSKDSGKREGMDLLKLPQQFLHITGNGDRAEGHSSVSFRIIFLILFTLTVK